MTDWPGEWGKPEDRWITGDWAVVAPGVKVRGYGLPNEEDCDEPVRIQVIARTDRRSLVPVDESENCW